MSVCDPAYDDAAMPPRLCPATVPRGHLGMCLDDRCGRTDRKEADVEGLLDDDDEHAAAAHLGQDRHVGPGVDTSAWLEDESPCRRDALRRQGDRRGGIAHAHPRAAGHRGDGHWAGRERHEPDERRHDSHRRDPREGAAHEAQPATPRRVPRPGGAAPQDRGAHEQHQPDDPGGDEGEQVCRVARPQHVPAEDGQPQGSPEQSGTEQRPPGRGRPLGPYSRCSRCGRRSQGVGGTDLGGGGSRRVAHVRERRPPRCGSQRSGCPTHHDPRDRAG